MELSKSDVEVRKFNTIKDRFGISQVEQWLKQIDKESKLSKKVQKEKSIIIMILAGICHIPVRVIIERRMLK